jgi:hypothetical protein
MIEKLFETHNVNECAKFDGDEVNEILTELKQEVVKLFPTISLPSEEEVREPIENALHGTGNFFTYECTKLASGILEYLNDHGYKIVRK